MGVLGSETARCEEASAVCLAVENGPASDGVDEDDDARVDLVELVNIRK